VSSEDPTRRPAGGPESGSSARRTCPSCREPLRDGAPGVACCVCATFHHPTCFAEQGGCAVHGCGCPRGDARPVGTTPPPPADFAARKCVRCGRPCPADALVARCGCRRVLDLACFEAQGHCGSGTCTHQAEVMPHVDAVRAQHLHEARGYFKTGAVVIVVAPVLGAAKLAGDDDAPLDERRFEALLVGGTLGGIGLLPLLLGQRERRRAPAPSPDR